ncbi:hypothetical protein PSD17_06350 [Pseudonocardia sp. D17]|nr:hypothetical protein PSD17_06350 [Pseudonocardia sp. D17]
MGFGVPATTAVASTDTNADAKTQTPADIETYGPRVELPGGMLLKQLGKVAETKATDNPGPWAARIVLDSITLDPKCDQYLPAPTRGHRLLLAVRVETSDTWGSGLGVPQSSSWSTVGEDGVTEGPTQIGYDCHSGKALPYEMRPAAKYRGEVTLDTANTKGQLILSNLFAWDYPIRA